VRDHGLRKHTESSWQRPVSKGLLSCLFIGDPRCSVVGEVVEVPGAAPRFVRGGSRLIASNRGPNELRSALQGEACSPGCCLLLTLLILGWVAVVANAAGAFR